MKYFLAAVIALFMTSMARAELLLDVSIGAKEMAIYQDGQLVDVWRINPAKRGYRSPYGTHRVQFMSKNHRSRRYNNAPMPNAIFFSGNYAIHAGRLDDAGSHGCIRVSRANSEILWNMVKRNPSNVKIVVGR